MRVFDHRACLPFICKQQQQEINVGIQDYTPRHKMQQSSVDDTFAHLSRLSQKSGVQATLILSRDTGAIVQSSGLVSRDESTNSEQILPPSNIDDRNDTAMPNAEHVAQVVWKFAKAAEEMLQDVSNSPDDDVKLLRLRSKNKEYVIFPGIFLSFLY
jgi:dynein light chain roadblock-type